MDLKTNKPNNVWKVVKDYLEMDCEERAADDEDKSFELLNVRWW